MTNFSPPFVLGYDFLQPFTKSLLASMGSLPSSVLRWILMWRLRSAIGCDPPGSSSLELIDLPLLVLALDQAWCQPT